MKKIFSLLAVFTTLWANAQTVTFTQRVYNVNQTIKATAIGGLVGIENDITQSSSVASDGTVTLGTPARTGFYNINFIFGTGSARKIVSYLVIVLPRGVTSTDPMVLNLRYDKNAKQDDRNIFEQVFKYFDEQPLSAVRTPIVAGLQTFAIDNSVDVVQNVAFCIAATQSGLPVVVAICRDMSGGNLEKLSLKVFQQIFLDMKNKGYLNQAQHTEVTNHLTRYASLGEILSSNCSLIFQSISNRIDNADLKLAISYQEQLCTSTEIVIKHFKKLP